MASHQLGPSNRRRSWLIVAALVIWIAVVVAGAGDTASDSLLGVQHLEIVWIAGLGLMAALGLVLIIKVNPLADGSWSQPDKRRGGGGFMMLLIAAVAIWRPDLIERLLARVQQVPPDEEAIAPLEPSVPDVVEPTPETVAQLSDLLLLLVAIGAIGLVLFLLRRRSAPIDVTEPVAEPESLEADLVVALEQLSIELATATDPRMSVLSSYAVLESVLADHGSRRLRSETPTEHLRRSLAHLRVDAKPIVHLGELYEIARFSNHPITSRQQLDAAAALDLARAELASRP